MATLTGTKIKDTYDGLLKVTDNVGINSTKKIITDGLGNNSSVKISSEDFEVGGFFYVDIDGNLPDSKIGIGTSSPSETLHVVGDFRLTARFYDGSNSPGLSGRVLMSTGSATSWSNTFSSAMTFNAGVILNAGIKDYPPLDPGQHTFLGEEEDLNKYNVEGYDHFENPCGHLNPPEAFGPGGPLTNPT